MNASELYEKRESFYLDTPTTLKGAIAISLLIGVACAAGGFYSDQGTRVWGALLFNLFFFFSLGLGGLALSAIQDVVGAVWARPIRRLHEGFGAFVPVAAVFFGIFLLAVSMDLLGAGKVYSWIADPSILNHFHGKDVWLVPGFMYARDVFFLVVKYLIASFKT